jgi:hypothetical protein
MALKATFIFGMRGNRSIGILVGIIAASKVTGEAL